MTKAQANGEISQRRAPRLYDRAFGHFFTDFDFKVSFSINPMDAESIEAHLMMPLQDDQK